MHDSHDDNIKNVAVCVTGQRDCDQLIRAGRELADSTGGALVVMSALPRLAHAGAQMLVMYTNRPFEALTDGFKKHGIGHVLLGEPRRRSSQMRTRLKGGYPGAKYYALDQSGHACQTQQLAACAL